ncbi:MAG: hypothetical protein AMK72_09910 [Planctomycetes bacterium SM23_25]|nr:MAG: hypothetical protein AMK72_09910 [Planctomycetes bacterium SM23_25]
MTFSGGTRVYWCGSWADGRAIPFDVPITKAGVVPEPFVRDLEAIARSLPEARELPATPK